MDYPHDKCVFHGDKFHGDKFHGDKFHGDKFHGDKVCVCDLQNKLPGGA